VSLTTHWRCILCSIQLTKQASKSK
jgi:hypothetical protein